MGIQHLNIDVLNQVGSDFHQGGKRWVKVMKPVILVGDKISCLNKVIQDGQSDNLCTLSRDNLMVNAIRKGISTNQVRKVIVEISLGDSNAQRRRTILWCARGIEYTEQGYFKILLKNWKDP